MVGWGVAAVSGLPPAKFVGTGVEAASETAYTQSPVLAHGRALRLVLQRAVSRADRPAAVLAPAWRFELQQEPVMKPNPSDPAMQGEGNITAARRHRKSAEKFVAQGKVGPAAVAAAPQSAEQAEAMRAAEAKGRSKARK